jgi:parallel beta-helix repeat protein
MATRLLRAARILGLAAMAAALPACHDSEFFTVHFYVDPAFGDDAFGDGTPSFPFRTITRALRFAISGDVIFLARGSYTSANGEIFPIFVKPGVLIQGDPPTKGVGPAATSVTGGGLYTIGGGTQGSTTVTAAFVMGSGAALSGVRITVAGATGVGVVFDGASASVTSCTITGCGGSGIRIYQAGSPSISNSVVTASGGSGIVVHDGAGPVLRQNSITANGADGVEANDASVPNLGDTATAGGNTIDTNTGVGLNNNTTASTIQAVGNTWIASTQGSDGSGNYAAALTPGPVAAAAANNFAIANGAAAIQF